MLRRGLKYLIPAALTLSGCQHAAPPPSAPLSHAVVGKAWKGQDRWFYPEAKMSFRETGLAVVDPRPRGYQTTDGEIWSPTAMTGAHQTLQLPLIVQVKNLVNGHIVRIRLNDRGPPDGKRILGITPQVARLLGSGRGPIPVEITPDQTLNEQLGFNDSAQPELDIKRTNRGAVVAQSLDGQPMQIYSGDATAGARPIKHDQSRDLPKTYTQSLPKKFVYKVVLGHFYDRNTASRLAARCGGLLQRSAGDGSNPSWQVAYGPFETSETADQAQLRAQRCGISNPSLILR